MRTQHDMQRSVLDEDSCIYTSTTGGKLQGLAQYHTCYIAYISGWCAPAACMIDTAAAPAGACNMPCPMHGKHPISNHTYRPCPAMHGA